MKTNQIISALLSRKSCRAYTKEHTSADELEAVVQAGLYAANGHGAQSAVLVVITNKEIRDQLSALNAAVMNSDSDPFYGAPEVIAVFGDSNTRTFVEDASLAIGNMLIAASSLGLGACWIHRAREVFQSPEGRLLKQQWGLPDCFEGVGFCIVGHPAAPGKSYERRADRIIRIN
jgi:nitroreductase